MGWADFYKAGAFGFVCFDSKLPTYLETICVLTNAAQTFVMNNSLQEEGCEKIDMVMKHHPDPLFETENYGQNGQFYDPACQ